MEQHSPRPPGLTSTRFRYRHSSPFAPSSHAARRPKAVRRRSYRLAWQGRYYQLWVQPAHPRISIVKHVPLGESNTLPYCGNGYRRAGSGQVCSINPVSVPLSAQFGALGRQAPQITLSSSPMNALIPLPFAPTKPSGQRVGSTTVRGTHVDPHEAWNGNLPHRRTEVTKLRTVAGRGVLIAALKSR